MALTYLGGEAKRHWEKHRPKMVKKLKQAGIYLKVLEETEGRAQSALADLASRREMNYHLAMKIVTQKWIYLPSEEEMPELPEEMMPYHKHTVVSPRPAGEAQHPS